MFRHSCSCISFLQRSLLSHTTAGDGADFRGTHRYTVVVYTTESDWLTVHNWVISVDLSGPGRARPGQAAGGAGDRIKLMTRLKSNRISVIAYAAGFTEQWYIWQTFAAIIINSWARIYTANCKCQWHYRVVWVRETARLGCGCAIEQVITVRKMFSCDL